MRYEVGEVGEVGNVRNKRLSKFAHYSWRFATWEYTRMPLLIHNIDGVNLVQ
jgi:hypothetical protein